MAGRRGQVWGWTGAPRSTVAILRGAGWGCDGPWGKSGLVVGGVPALGQRAADSSYKGALFPEGEGKEGSNIGRK